MDENELRAWLQTDYIPKEPAHWRPHQREFYRHYALAERIIRLSLGEDWFQTHIVPPELPPEPVRIIEPIRIAGGARRRLIHFASPDWFRPRKAPAESATEHFRVAGLPHERHIRIVSRVVELAELILNLHGIENFDVRLKEIREANGDGVEAGIATLFAGKVFKLGEMTFRFVRETGTTGLDYDIEYVRTDGRLGRCEVKCKVKANEFSAAGVRRTLKKARRQLPKGDGVSAGVVFLRIPEEWVPVATDRDAEVFSAVEEFFRREKTTRITSVIVATSETVVWTLPYWSQVLLSKEVVNPHCPIPSGLSLAGNDDKPPMDSPLINRIWKRLLPLAIPAPTRR